jgi:malate synthase
VGNARFATGHFLEAAALFKQMVAARELPDFLTLPAYDAVIAEEFAPTSGDGAAARL